MVAQNGMADQPRRFSHTASLSLSVQPKKTKTFLCGLCHIVHVRSHIIGQAESLRALALAKDPV